MGENNQLNEGENSAEEQKQAEEKNTQEENGQQKKAEDISKLKLLCALGYIPCGLLFFIPLIVYPNDRFAKFHANQALVLLLTSIVGEVLFSVLSVIPFLSVVMYILTSIFGLLMLVLCILGILNAAQAEQKPLPVIGKFTLIR